MYGPAFMPKSGNVDCTDEEIPPTKAYLEDWLTSACETVDRNKPFGVLGLYDLTKLPQAELEALKAHITAYKEVRADSMNGTFYRLTDGFSGNFTAWQLVSVDRKTAYVFLFQKLVFPVSQLPKFKLMGLSPDKVYVVDKTGVKTSGEVLMRHGLLFLQNYQGYDQSENGHSLTDFSAVVYKLEQVGD